MLLHPALHRSFLGKLLPDSLSLWVTVFASAMFMCIGQFGVIDGKRSALFLNCGGIGLIACLALSEVRRRCNENEIQRLREVATIDPLTGAGNRRSFDQELSRKITQFQRYGTTCSLLIVDADYFKSINDRWGHDVGDKVLKALVQAMSSTLRDIDLLFRIGGEEFAALLPETGSSKAMIAAERIRAAVSELEIPIPGSDERLRVTVSIGGSEIQFVDLSDGWFKRADEALYDAKRRGRNRVEVRVSQPEASQAEASNKMAAYSE
jgi:diguanylate cyclase (GGDEF)-like protein